MKPLKIWNKHILSINDWYHYTSRSRLLSYKRGGSKLELQETTIDNCVYSLFIKYPHPCVWWLEVVAFAFGYKDQAGGNLSWFFKLFSNIKVNDAVERKTKLGEFCETRWISRGDALTPCNVSFYVAVYSFNHLRDNQDGRAWIFLVAILPFHFILEIICVWTSIKSRCSSLILSEV